MARRPGRVSWWASVASVLLLLPAGLAAQTGPALDGRVLDDALERPVAGAVIVLRVVEGTPPGIWPRRVETGTDGTYRFEALTRGRYVLTVARVGYRSLSIDVELRRDEPVRAVLRMTPAPLPVAPVELDVVPTGVPTLRPPAASGSASPVTSAEALRSLQSRSLSSDLRRIGYEDLRQANTLAEDDLYRALQRLPGVSARDDYTADLWTRGAPGGHTVLRFDGIPVLGAFHALGGLSGLNTDMLSTVTFQPGVLDAQAQGGAAAAVDVTTRSGMEAPGAGSAALSPISARASTHARHGDRVAWAAGARRSYADAVASLANDLGLISEELPYAFHDVTGRVDLILGSRYRLEASAFGQEDRVFGDVPGLASAEQGAWGTVVARASLVGSLGDVAMRHTVGSSLYDVALRGESASSGGPDAPHPPTENAYRIVVWESRFDAPGAWSAGVTASRERHEYAGPGIDLARLLSREELERRGIGDLTPVLEGLGHAGLRRTDAMTRLAGWGQLQRSLTPRLLVEGGVRVESGDPVAGRRVRLAPRLRARWYDADRALSFTAGFGRSYQYVQSVSLTDVARPGLRASEILDQAGDDTPALRSDVATLGSQAWIGTSWLAGAHLWTRRVSGILVPDPTPGVLDGPRPAVAASSEARGLEMTVRRVEGAVRVYVNHTLSRTRLHVGRREYNASEDRRHVTNAGVTVSLSPKWRVGATATVRSGTPYTRITVVDAECDFGAECVGPPPVLYGTPGLQRTGTFGTLDLFADRTFVLGSWTLTGYAQLRNALGNVNAVTYHSSCVCPQDVAEGASGLRDQFDAGLPRLPLIGVRARFR